MGARTLSNQTTFASLAGTARTPTAARDICLSRAISDTEGLTTQGGSMGFPQANEFLCQTGSPSSACLIAAGIGPDVAVHGELPVTVPNRFEVPGAADQRPSPRDGLKRSYSSESLCSTEPRLWKSGLAQTVQ